MARSIGFAIFAFCLAVGIAMAQSKNTPHRVSVSDIGKSVELVGRLGNPLGKMMEVRGTWRLPKEIFKDSSLRFAVSHVNGLPLKEPVEFNVFQLKLLTTKHGDATPTRDEWKALDSVEWHLIAYETGYIGITPDEYSSAKPHFPIVGMPYYSEAFTSQLISIVNTK